MAARPPLVAPERGCRPRACCQRTGSRPRRCTSPCPCQRAVSRWRRHCQAHRPSRAWTPPPRSGAGNVRPAWERVQVCDEQVRMTGAQPAARGTGIASALRLWRGIAWPEAVCSPMATDMLSSKPDEQPGSAHQAFGVLRARKAPATTPTRTCTGLHALPLRTVWRWLVPRMLELACILRRGAGVAHRRTCALHTPCSHSGRLPAQAVQFRIRVAMHSAASSSVSIPAASRLPSRLAPTVRRPWRGQAFASVDPEVLPPPPPPPPPPPFPTSRQVSMGRP